MKRYIDLDGVIVDTEKILFDDYEKLRKKSNSIKMDFIRSYDWDYLLKRSEIINDAIEVIKSLPPESIAILTKVCSMNNEGIAKIKFLRSKGLKNEIFLTPFQMKKTDIVKAKGNILIDDTVHNLDDWSKDEGISIFFDKFNNNVDSWNKENKKYKRIRNLYEVL